MSKEKRRVPKLRFPGFTEDWEQRKADYIFKSVTEKGYPELPVLSASQELGMVYRNQNGIDIQHDKKNESSYKRVSPGQFVIHLRSFQGGFAYSEVEGITSPAYTVMSFKNSSEQYGLFWKYVFKSETFIKRLETITYGIRDGRNISFSDFKSLMLQYPSFLEQELIGDLIAIIESGITLHQRKLNNLKLKKKALLQKLFPKNGERYPELRFPGFTDAWEQRKLGSIGSTYTGLSGKTKEDFGHGEAQYITYLNVFQNTISNITMTDKVEIDTTQTEVKYGDVLFTTSSETPEEVGMSSVWLGDTPNTYLNSFCFGFRPKQKIDLYFLGYSLRAPYMRDKIKILAQGISRYNISKNKVMELEISLPNNEEQNLLGNFLRHIDLIITLHQRKLDHLQLQKKALLQQMFV